MATWSKSIGAVESQLVSLSRNVVLLERISDKQLVIRHEYLADILSQMTEVNHQKKKPTVFAASSKR